MKFREMSKTEKIKKEIQIFDIIFIGLILALSILVALNYKYIREIAQYELSLYGLSAIFIFVFFLEFLPQVLSPDYIILLAVASGFNLNNVIIYSIVASALGSFLAFLVGYHFGFDTISPLIKEKTLNKITKFWGTNGKIFVLLSAIVPLPIPYFPLVFGALRMKKIDFILWGIIPRTLGIIATGVFAYFGFDFLNSLM